MSMHFYNAAGFDREQRERELYDLRIKLGLQERPEPIGWGHLVAFMKGVLALIALGFAATAFLSIFLWWLDGGEVVHSPLFLFGFGL
jgi:hypothetical protein